MAGFALFGIAIVARPAGIITAGYMTEISESEESANNEAAEEPREPEVV